MSEILDELPRDFLTLVHRDLVGNGRNPLKGRKAMTAEQVLRAIIVKQMNEYSYRTLAFHLLDSNTYQAFCRFPLGKVPKKAALQQNIKRVRPETMEQVNRAILKKAKFDGVEKGRKVRTDCTVVETNIHDPMDSWLLFDCVRVLTRLMVRGYETFPISFSRHNKRAKRRALGILNAKNNDERRPLYRDLVVVTGQTLDDALRYVGRLKVWKVKTLRQELLQPVLIAELERFVNLTLRVIDQTERRIFKGETVPSNEKVVSIFEPHTDIIVKSRRETEFGHKICLTTGASSLILDCVVLEGNPNDSDLARKMIDRQIEIYERPPRQAAFDGAFASAANVEDIKGQGVKDVMFSKKRGMEVLEMVKSSWVYQRLRNFRAGIEGGISFLKRCFGLDRCTWSGLPSFKSYVWSSIVTANLLILARHKMA
jgi:IS5 family transposase